ncbi:integrase/recombinase XerD [Anaerobium acetethylicum]|uniref:Integrase/recombinase XerD n=2 Tax=Anaerobium acetethylicum TaxID=1619234 RepID=A0A1D3TWY1_9FIRM|nr:integrase/recombinase XerD [Anaerobium acetethylicum]
MIILNEIKKDNTNIFERIHADDNGKIIFREEIHYRLYKIKKKNTNTFVLYNDNMEVVSPVYRFINIKMAKQPYNSREKSIYALRFLHCFLSLTKTKLTDLNHDNIEKLKYFLLGYSPSQGSYSMNLQTVRSNATVNEYLQVYRSFFSYLGIKCDSLFETREFITFNINPITEKAENVTSYKSNLKTGTPVKRVPRYISVDNFKTIISIIRNDRNLLAECIVRLMYQFGLRLGEVLGLTFEDLAEIEINGKLCPVLYLRDRLSDDFFQHAKTCMHITNAKQYKSKDYQTEGVGYQQIIITYDIYELLNEYIERAHAKARAHNHSRYCKKVSADTTSTINYSEDNYYVFLNSIGTVLSAQTWNKYIKSVFVRADIPIDTGSKTTNLSHRFRHGFAMFQVQYLKTHVLELQKLMRHKSLASTMKYYNPTEEDEYKIKNTFVNELYDLIPGLKENAYE